MNKLIDNLLNINHIEELARRNHWINTLHPLVKFLVTIVYIIALTSVGKYELSRTILFGIYPIVIILVADLPLRRILPKIIIPIIFGASLGILNPLFDVNVFQLSETLLISAGWISFAALMIKSLWMILTVLILVATTPVEELAYSLMLLKLPKVMCIQFLLTFRYLTILLSEFDRTITAYSLRSGGNRSIDMRVWGSLLGQLFFRASQRSIKLYDAMQLRGFNGIINIKKRALRYVDGLYLSAWISTIGILIGLRGGL